MNKQQLENHEKGRDGNNLLNKIDNNFEHLAGNVKELVHKTRSKILVISLIALLSTLGIIVKLTNNVRDNVTKIITNEIAKIPRGYSIAVKDGDKKIVVISLDNGGVSEKIITTKTLKRGYYPVSDNMAKGGIGGYVVGENGEERFFQVNADGTIMTNVDQEVTEMANHDTDNQAQASNTPAGKDKQGNDDKNTPEPKEDFVADLPPHGPDFKKSRVSVS